MLDQMEHKVHLGHLDHLVQMVHQVSKELREHLVLVGNKETQALQVSLDQLDQPAVMASLAVTAEMEIEENKGLLVHKDQEVYPVNEVSMELMEGLELQVMPVNLEKQELEE